MGSKKQIDNVVMWYTDEKGQQKEAIIPTAYMRRTKEILEGQYTGRMITTLIFFSKGLPGES